MSSGEIESGPGAFSSFRSWRATANFLSNYSIDSLAIVLGPPTVRHFLRYASAQFTINLLLFPASHQLESFRWNRTELRNVSNLSVRFFKNIPYLSTWMWEVDVLNCLRRSVMSTSSRVARWRWTLIVVACKAINIQWNYCTYWEVFISVPWKRQIICKKHQPVSKKVCWITIFVWSLQKLDIFPVYNDRLRDGTVKFFNDNST